MGSSPRNSRFCPPSFLAKKGKKIKDLRRRTEQASVPVKRHYRVLEKERRAPVAGSNPNLDYDYIWCYATLQVMKLTYPTSLPLFSTYSSYHQKLWPQQPCLLAARPPALQQATTRYAPSRHPYHRLWVSSHPRRHAHRSRLLIATRCRWCGATAANHAESSVASQPQSATLAETSTNARIMG